METGRLNPFRGTSRFWTYVPGGSQTQIELPTEYARLWQQTRLSLDECVYLTTASGEISQIGITRWNGSVFLTDGLPEFICFLGLSPNDLLVFSYTEFTSLRVAMLNSDGQEYQVNQGMANAAPEVPNTNPPARTTFLPSGIPTYYNQPPAPLPVTIVRRCRITLKQLAIMEPYILEIPIQFARDNLQAGVNNINLNFDGDGRFKIHCVMGPIRAIATTGWEEFAKFARLQVGEKLHILNTISDPPQWNVEITPADI